MNRFLIIFLLASCLGLHAETSDSLRNILLEEVSIVSTIKENGQMRQQPASVTLIDRQQMDEDHVVSLKGASRMVPNLFIPDYGSHLTSAIYIRGIGSRLNTPAVGLYVDNIPYVDKSAFDFNFYDIERADVMRGPQGTLYGRNTMGGLIRVFSKNPLYYEGTNARLSFATGDYHRSVSLTHYHHISNKLGFSAGGYYESGDGFFKNTTTGKKADAMMAAGGRIRAVYNPVHHLLFDFTASFDHNDEGAYPYYYTGSLTGTEAYSELIGTISNNKEHKYRRNLLNVGLNTEYRADTWQMNAVTGFQHINDRMFMDQDFIQPDIYTLEQRQRINTLTEEVTFKSTKKQTWEWISGVNIMYQTLHTTGPVVFYEDGLRWLESNINSAMPEFGETSIMRVMGFKTMGVNFRGDNLLMDGTYDTPTLNLALFHQSTIHLADRLDATLGLRIDYDHQQMKYHSPADVLFGFTMKNSMSDKMSVNLQDLESHILYDGCIKNNRVRLLPKLSLKYNLENNSNVYFTTAMGQRSGGYNLQMFSDLLQGAMRVDMMQKVQEGVGNYLDYLVENNPNIPKQVPDGSGNMVALPDYVKKMMSENMPQLETPSTSQVVYQPEYSISNEAGTHLNIGQDNKLMLDAAIFYNRIYNQQIARFAPSGLGRMMVNAGKSQSCGGELSLLYRPNSHLMLNANYGFTHSTFIDYDDAGGNDYSGKYVPYVPMHTVTIGVDYKWNIKNTSPFMPETITLGANGNGAGRIYWTESNNVSQPFYAMLGAHLTAAYQDFTIQLWGKNLTNNKYNTFYFESASRGFEQHCKPLQVGIDINITIK